MKKKELLARWADVSFLASVEPLLDALFSRKAIDGDYDLRGLIVGLNGQPSSLGLVDFQDASLNGTDLSFGQFSCAFSRASLSSVDLSDTKLDTCRLAGTQCAGTRFCRSRISAPTFDDARFQNCDFSDAQMRGRGASEYGGRRVTFENCLFTGTKLKALEFRAAKFIGCTFEGTVFDKCTLSGVQFFGNLPDPEQFTGCTLGSIKLDAEPVDLS